MSSDLSKRALGISPSLTLEITDKAQKMKKSGIDIIGFGAGEPDFNTPENIQNAGIEAIKAGKTRYTAASGIPELKTAICEKLKRDNNLEYDNSNILISSGAKHSIFNAFYAILNPGDEVIIPVPYWVSYPEFVKVVGGIPVLVKTTEDNGFKYTKECLESAITKKTKAIILNSPSNPTGTVYTKAELEMIAEIAVKNNIFVISDEIYEKLVYDGEEHISIASINEDIKKLTIVINGMSKAYAMTGWRIGYAAADSEIVKVMSNVQSHTTSNACSVSQYASVEALTGDQSVICDMIKEFDKRRVYMVDRISKINYLSCRKPKGAFYVMANISAAKGKTIRGREIKDSLDFTSLLLEEAEVAVVPGIAFGDDDYVRLSYATSMDNIEKGLDRIEKVLAE